MKSPLKPLGRYVVAKSDELATKTASGLYLTKEAQEKPKTATVIAIGPEVDGVKVGDRIIYKSYSSTDVEYEKVEYILVDDADILATVKESK